MNEAASIWPPPTVAEVNAKRPDGELDPVVGSAVGEVGVERIDAELSATDVGSAVVIFAELPQAVSAAAAVIKATVRIARR